MRIRLTDYSKKSLVKRVIDMENHGWECISPIKSVTKGTVIKEIDNSWQPKTYVEDSTKWHTMMEKREENVKKNS